VTYAPYKNDNWWEENKPEIEKPVAAAAQADIIIACIGENSYCETPGNLTDLTLSENQRNLVKALAATGKPIVLVLNQGRPRIINDIEPLAKAVSTSCCQATMVETHLQTYWQATPTSVERCHSLIHDLSTLWQLMTSSLAKT
jgi:hypothetical protein